jgi:hypothetical protein
MLDVSLYMNLDNNIINSTLRLSPPRSMNNRFLPGQQIKHFQRQTTLGQNNYTKSKLSKRNQFCRRINNITMSTNVTYLQFTLSNNVSDIMVLNINVFCSLKEYNIVIISSSWLNNMVYWKFAKELGNKHNLNPHHDNILPWTINQKLST